jgi:ankyrin repeat protein
VRLANGYTPLEYALHTKRIDAFEALLSHPDTCLWHPGTSLLHTIICTSTTEKPLRLLLKEITRRGQNTPGSERIDTLTHPRFITPLLLAIQDRHSNMALEILKTPAEFDIDNVSATGRTTLHAACDKGLSDVAIALIERGAVVSAVDCDGETPLYCACVKRMSDVAVRLLAHGADACAANLAGTTVLHAACTSNLPIVIVALLAHGANVFAADDRGVRPAFGMLDAQYGQVVANAHATQFMKRILCMVAALQRTKRRGLPIELWQLILSDYIELPFALKNIAVQRL